MKRVAGIQGIQGRTFAGEECECGIHIRSGAIGGISSGYPRLRPVQGLLYFLDDPERAEHVDNQSDQDQHEKDLRPELPGIDAGGVRVPGMELRVDIIAEKRAPAFGADFVKLPIPMTAPGAGERSITGRHGTS
jgi:hypothetical protein